MHRRARVELTIEVDLESPLEAVAMAQELRSQASRDQWEALVLVSSAVMEQVSSEMAAKLLREAKAREQR